MNETHSDPTVDRRQAGLCLAENRLPMLITGMAGVPGYNAFPYFRNRYGENVIGQRMVRNWPLQAPGIIPCDLEDTLAFRKLLRQHDVKTILNCGGSCALKSCELDPQMAYRVNVNTVDRLIDAIDDLDIKLIHLSIDLVFSGKKEGDYRENDVCDPVTVYGKTMVQAEDIVIKRRPNACILRISLPMGMSFNGHAGAIDWIQNRFAKNKPATLYFDEIRTPTYVQCLNELFEEVISKDLSGIYHAGGPSRLSLFQIAQIVNRVGGYDPSLLRGCPRGEAGPIPPRAGNVTMNSGLLGRALDRPVFFNWPLKGEHLPTDCEWHFDRSDWTGGRELITKNLYHRPISSYLSKF